ncbi:hypothetical protein ABTY53_06070 [Streptomyces noursei]|uniref:hypothetical protein n=1 Tax=Streptomyces noursei TaxID=1971 RepID=UPI00332D3204
MPNTVRVPESSSWRAPRAAGRRLPGRTAAALLTATALLAGLAPAARTGAPEPTAHPSPSRLQRDADAVRDAGVTGVLVRLTTDRGTRTDYIGEVAPHPSAAEYHRDRWTPYSSARRVTLALRHPPASCARSTSRTPSHRVTTRTARARTPPTTSSSPPTPR